MKKIRVLIVEDSNVVRELLEYIIGRDPRLEIAGSVGSAEEALRVLDQLSPDVISMDIRLPGMNGLEAARRIMTEKPTPIVVVAARIEAEDLQIAAKALLAGALTVLEKPPGPASAQYELLAEKLCTQLVIMSQVKVVRKHRELEALMHEPPSLARLGRFNMIGIVTSTGGPSAVASLLVALGPNFPLPVLLVQHIGSTFLAGFARWLENVCPFEVKIVKDRQIPVRGTVYLGSENSHLRITGLCVESSTSEPICSQRPSGTVLFESMAKALGRHALGVLLTGMGRDGAQGLLKIRQFGGHTIAEDESTAVVYGMPAEAVRLGAVCESLPLPAIAPRILELTLRTTEDHRANS
jgi:two-component system, chemotaxis family, protein-glutamate methylesterase/glutaminase